MLSEGRCHLKSDSPGARKVPVPIIRLERCGDKGLNTLLLDPRKIIHVVADRNNLMTAYRLLRSKPGCMTPGVDKETLDRFRYDTIEKLHSRILSGSFKFRPRRLVHIPKPGTTEIRPLMVGSPLDKVVQISLKLALEPLWEPGFNPMSHGFRPGRGCHTALKMVQQRFKNPSWIIEADIDRFFDRVDHDVLIRKVEEKVTCAKTLALLRNFLRAGYLDKQRKLMPTLIGIPQGSVLAPLLRNVYLDRLDQYMAESILGFERGKARKGNKTYNALASKLTRALGKVKSRAAESKGAYLLKPLDPDLVLSIRRQIRSMPSKDPIDPGFRRLRYVRYADDFLIGVIGSLAEAQGVLDGVSHMLGRSLKLDLKGSKTGVKSARKGTFFLGTKIFFPTPSTCSYYTTGGGRMGGRPVRSLPYAQFGVPVKHLLGKLKDQGFLKERNGVFRGTRLGRLTPHSHKDILDYYNAVIRGTLEYYRHCDNRCQLHQLVYLLKQSCALTLKSKLSLRSQNGAYAKFGSDLQDPYSGRIFYSPKSLKGLTCSEQWGRGKQLSDLDKAVKYVIIGKYTAANLDYGCVICGSQAKVEMHHLRSVRSLKRQRKEAKSPADQTRVHMEMINRKQVPLCRSHHQQVTLRQLGDAEVELFRKGCKGFLKIQYEIYTRVSERLKMFEELLRKSK